jgi:uncharacterized protein (UPF0218 family)
LPDVKTFEVSEDLKETLKKPMGNLLLDIDQTKENLLKKLGHGLIVSVGDRTTERLVELGIVPDLQIVDGIERRVRRKIIAFSGSQRDVFHASNHAGTISRDALLAMSKVLAILKRKERTITRIEIKGEEDLLVLPVLAYFPEKTAVAYGQPGEGMVIVLARGKTRVFARKLLRSLGVRGLIRKS